MILLLVNDGKVLLRWYAGVDSKMREFVPAFFLPDGMQNPLPETGEVGFTQGLKESLPCCVLEAA